MDILQTTRVLLVSADPALLGEARRLLASAGPDGAAAPSAPSCGAAQAFSLPPPPTGCQCYDEAATPEAGGARPDEVPEGATPQRQPLAVDVATDGKQGLELVRQAIRQRQPYAMALVDGQLPPPGCVETVRHLCEADPALLLLVCAGPQDPPRDELARQLACADRFLFLSRPLEATEVRQLTAVQLDRRLARQRWQETVAALCSTRRALERTREQAAEAGRAKDEFIANVSHEVRTPMNAILGFSQILMRDPLTPAQSERLTHIHNAGKSLLSLIDNVLDFSKLATGKLKLRSLAFDLDTVIGHVLEATRPAARQKGLSVDWHAEQAVPRHLRGDPLRLRQVLVNLVENAIKFTEIGTVHIQAAVDEEDDRAATLRFVITDTGVGIPADRQAVVFDSFSQADGSSTRRFGGLGLGLTICKQLVDLMGGQIGFRSSLGRGSSFWLSMTFRKQPASSIPPAGPAGLNARPAAPPAAPPPVLAASPGPCRATPPVVDPAGPPDGRRRILVAEDDRLNRVLLEALLGRAGCILDLAGNGHEALVLLRQHAYELVLMDLDMPGISGLEAMDTIRRQEAGSLRHVPIIALTAHASPEVRRQCIEAGADDYLAKPFSHEDLFAAIDRRIPGFLESLELESSLAAQAEPPGRPDLPSTPAECMAALQAAMEGGDFRGLERYALRLKAVAARRGPGPVADHAMRIQLAARGKDLGRARAAVERLGAALRDNPRRAPNCETSLSL